MEKEMEFLQAPEENLRTWSRVIKIFTWSCVSIAILLLVMAAALL